MNEYSVFDIANWFLNKSSMSPKKLQKLTYYAQAWSYALYNQTLINDTVFEAWSHGPVSPELYHKYKKYGWRDIDKNSEIVQVDDKAKVLLESVWLTYGDKSANELEALTHQELPWQEARRRAGANCSDRCNEHINVEDMKKYYLSIYSGD